MLVINRPYGTVQQEQSEWLAAITQCTGGLVCINAIRSHVSDVDFSVDSSKTDLFIHVIGRTSGGALSASALAALLSPPSCSAGFLLAAPVYGLAGASPVAATEQFGALNWLIVAVALLIILLLIALIVLCCMMRCRSVCV